MFILTMVKKSKQIQDRIDWFAGLHQDILEKVKDPEIAKIVFRKVTYEDS